MPDLVLVLILGTGCLLAVAALLGPPLFHYWQQTADIMEGALGDYYSHWFDRSAQSRYHRSAREAKRRFDQWFDQRFGGDRVGGMSEDELIGAQRLFPVIRQLLESDVPVAIRRCNDLHHRTAKLTGVVHMREVAGEPECIGFRQFVSLLLEKTVSLLDQYPLSMRLETDDLLDATIILRKRLAPTCANCPYIRQPVNEAGERCPAAALIGIK